MSRTARLTPGGMVFHVLNRGVGRMRLFNKDRDYEVKAIRQAVNRGQPYGNESWINRTAKRLGLESTMRRRGQPNKVIPKPQY